MLKKQVRKRGVVMDSKLNSKNQITNITMKINHELKDFCPNKTQERLPTFLLVVGQTSIMMSPQVAPKKQTDSWG